VEFPLSVPELVHQRALANGAAGRRWLERLPELVSALAARWDLRLGQTLDGGTASYVVTATDGVGRACVLKLGMPLDTDEPDAFARSVRVHQLADGRGCAKLFDHDLSIPAMLLERLGPNLHDLKLPLPRVLDVIAATLHDFWRPVGPDSHLPTGADKAAWLARYVDTTWMALGRPCDRAVIDRAIALCDRRASAFDEKRAVLVHGDAHGWNTLQAGRGGFKFVDPEGLRSDPEHDLSVAMREYNRPLLAGDTASLVRQRAESLATRCQVDADAVWEWGFVERVSTGLANLRELQDGEGQAFLEVAARCL
jgi:streptomycin 6-kinase